MLDLHRLYHKWVGIVGCIGFDERHRPINGQGDILPDQCRMEFFLQDGKVFDAGGSEVYRAEVPAAVRAWLGSLPAIPGITAAPRRVIQCPQCEMRFCIRRFFEKHLVAHGLNEEQIVEVMRQVDGGSRELSVPWDAGDFADVPQSAMPVTEPGLKEDGEE